jgi:hypothetical protein
MIEQANGQLPEHAQRAVDYTVTEYLHKFQEMTVRCDELFRENVQLKTDIAAFKVQVEAQTSLLNEMETRTNEAFIKRDEAVAARVVYECVFASIHAQLHAFKVPVEPLVKNEEAEEGSEA